MRAPLPSFLATLPSMARFTKSPAQRKGKIEKSKFSSPFRRRHVSLNGSLQLIIFNLNKGKNLLHFAKEEPWKLTAHELAIPLALLRFLAPALKSCL